MEDKELEAKLWEVTKVLGVIFGIPFLGYVAIWIGMIVAFLINVILGRV